MINHDKVTGRNSRLNIVFINLIIGTIILTKFHKVKVILK